MTKIVDRFQTKPAKDGAVPEVSIGTPAYSRQFSGSDIFEETAEIYETYIAPSGLFVFVERAVIDVPDEKEPADPTEPEAKRIGIAILDPGGAAPPQISEQPGVSTDETTRPRRSRNRKED